MSSCSGWCLLTCTKHDAAHVEVSGSVHMWLQHDVRVVICGDVRSKKVVIHQVLSEASQTLVR